METREILKRVRMVELKTRGPVDQVFSGEYHSIFKGRGIDFDEVREYQFGDDIRSIDWNVSARCDRPFVKVYREDRELTVMLVVDASRSGDFGTDRRLKREVAMEVCALFAFSAIRNHDKVGLILFTDRIERFVPPQKGRAHVLRIIRDLVSFEPEGRGTDIRAALEHFHRVIKKRSIVFLVSDFVDTGYERILATLARKHDLIAVEIVDPREEELPDAGLVRLRDAETGRWRWIDTGSGRVREAFRRYWSDHREAYRAFFLRHRIDRILVRVDRPYVRPIVDFFRFRGRRLRRVR
jgi:uncharacterized protein (DUF58 family)